MATKDQFLRSLSEQKEASEATNPDVLKGWLGSLTRLYRTFTGWLAEPVADGLLRVSEVVVPVEEELLGKYDAPSLKIVTHAGKAIHNVPKARLVVGAFGRVDFLCSPKKLILVQSRPDQWHFVELAPDKGGWSYGELTEDSFWKALQHLLA